jgi:hypothetical protein
MPHKESREREPWEGETCPIKSRVRKERSQKGRKNPEQKPHKRDIKKSWLSRKTTGERSRPQKEKYPQDKEAREREKGRPRKANQKIHKEVYSPLASQRPPPLLNYTLLPPPAPKPSPCYP